MSWRTWWLVMSACVLAVISGSFFVLAAIAPHII